MHNLIKFAYKLLQKGTIDIKNMPKIDALLTCDVNLLMHFKIYSVSQSL